jgi:eukaryotic-like serine/threonine-protein kinase
MQGGSSSAAGVREGDILAGKYRVERVLGIGGMGVVVAAHHIQLDEKVALKFLLPDALHNAQAVARFVREARAAVKIKNEHVARVSDVGTLPNGAPYMVMEYLDGGDLAAWIQERGALPVEQAVEFVLQACVAVADAHALGIVHRDLKPANLFCARRTDGQLSIKVLDFGISKMTQLGGSGPSAMTNTTALMGSPLYMSPEQMRSAKDVNPQTDLWAIGTILFELLTGKPPFLGESLPELVLRITNDPPPSLRSFRPEVPAALEAVILRCLEKDRQRRYPNVAELALALLPFAPKRGKASVERISGIIQAAGLSQSALALPASPLTEGTVASAGTAPPLSQTAGVPGASPRRGAGVAVVIAGLLVVGGAGIVVARRGAARSVDSSAPTAPPAASALAVSRPPPPETATPASAPAATESPSAAPAADAGQLAPAAAQAKPASRPLAPTPAPAPVTPVNPVSRPASTPKPAPPLPPPPPTQSYDHM